MPIDKAVGTSQLLATSLKVGKFGDHVKMTARGYSQKHPPLPQQRHVSLNPRPVLGTPHVMTASVNP